MIVEFTCRACGPQVATFPSATVWCSRGKERRHAPDCICDLHLRAGPPQNRRLSPGKLRQVQDDPVTAIGRGSLMTPVGPCQPTTPVLPSPE
jgi:hypothetical protein